ncbi:Septin-domain-containing protein, partial [Yamadazyma tenuis ATCC 10573]
SAHELNTRRISKRFVDFNLLLIGENGVGKKSFINTLCEEAVFDITDTTSSTSEFHVATNEVIIRKEYPIRLTVHRTENFGAELNNYSSFQKIVDFLDEKLEQKLAEESKIARSRCTKEGLIHLVVLLVDPIMKGLKPLEVELISRIQHKCNLVVCVSKCDMLNYPELQQQKSLIQQSVATNKLKVFDFKAFVDEEDVDSELKEYYRQIQQMMPFSIINANDSSHGVRNNIHHSVDVNKFSDFNVVRDVLFNLDLQGFKELSVNTIYEIYRTEKLLQK